MLDLLREHFVFLDKEYVEGEVYQIRQSLPLKGKNISEARILMAGFGLYDALLNGKKIGKQLFKPGYTYYPRRALYQEYDIRDELKRENSLQIYVGQGWYCGRFFCENTVQNYGPLPSVSYVVKVVYEDGDSDIFFPEEGMKAFGTEYVYAGEYDGETVDFTKPDLDREIGTLSHRAFPEGVLLEPTLNEVRVQEEMTIHQVVAHDGYTIVDFGQNFAGIVAIDPRRLGEGERIVIRHGEILNPDGSLYTANLRAAKATISYRKGANEEPYLPRFTYMGFRYVEIRGAAYQEGLIKAFAIHTEMEPTGDFHCGDPKVQRLFQNVVWGQKSNYVEVPTDCPQRDERFGYTGDGHVFALTGSYNFNTLRFWKNYFRDLDLGQLDNPDGNVPPYLPQVGPKPVGFMSMQGWGSAVSIIPKAMYEQYGDLDFFLSQFEAIRKYVDLEIKKAGRKRLWKAISLGDWLSLRKGMAWQAMNNHPVSNAFFVNDLRILLELLRLKGDQALYDHYHAIFLQVKKAYVKAFIGKSGKVRKDYQGTYVLALRHVLEESDEITPLVRKRFVENVRKYGLDTGFFGTEHLLPLLAEIGESRLAYDLLLSETCPGWLYQVNKGATTTWERWDALREDGTVNEERSGKDNMVSFNHYSFGSVGEFYYRYILGIKPAKPGYEEALIRPYSDPRLGFAKGHYRSVHGTIESSWRREGSRVIYDFALDMAGTIRLEDGAEYRVGPGRYHYEINLN